MLKVAVTGGIGSGKTIICSIFEKLGIPVFYADKEAKILMNTNTDVIEKIINSFGRDVYDDHFQLNRTKFANIIFNNQNALSVVNSIVHPAVRNEFGLWAAKQTSPYVIQEAAIIFESGQQSNYDKIITVTAPVEIRIQRVIERDHVGRDKVIERMNNQMDESKKAELSDFVIENDGEKMILPQILNIHNKLLK